MSCALRIGLTGGIGSGKTEASRFFSQLGVPIIDTDLIARELVQAGQPALSEIAATFGADLLDSSGNLDRDRLRQLVFSDPGKRKLLESILHPRIREQAQAGTERLDAAYCVLVIPLLLETAHDYPVDRVLVVDAPAELQQQRVARRDGLSGQAITAIMESQASREQRRKAADDVIVNDASLQKLQQEIERLHRYYLDLSSSPAPGR